MGKTVTFSFNSGEYIGTAATETFTLDELGIDEILEGVALKEELDRVFKAG
ncbi:hypothetical protein [Sporosarcina sp. Te-1]|uniref:hypothetical protein n=1 Tax=Sporosarcina sp. Te-1 TaxID=2818390 RepID=UPI001A9F0C23|nr:hypothetical protein [Sporosarcina sp. Te-1]QTD42109.1 hypothetical protein J3U78_04575 [Sporosarcina sp. Te-1]